MKPSGTNRPAYKRKKWNILFIGEDGKVLSVKHFKGMVAGVALLVVIMAATIGVLFYQYRDRADQMRALQLDMTGVVEENRDLKIEKDQMLARQVILESKLKMQQADDPSPVVDAAAVNAEPQQDPADKPLVADVSGGSGNEAQKRVQPAGTAGSETDSSATAAPVGITNKNLLVCRDPESASVRVEYKVINLGSRNTQVTGRSVIVLKNDDMDPADWVVLPNAPLSDRKPSGKEGKQFRIYNFRTLKYMLKASDIKDQMNYATIYTYNDNGELLMERDYPLEMATDMCP